METGDLVERFNKDGSVHTPMPKKETRTFNGKKFLLEQAIKGDVALIRAHRVDRNGNTQFRFTTRNHGGPMARSAKLTIVEADEIVEVGEIHPNEVHVPSIYIDRIVKSTSPKRLVKTVIREREGEAAVDKSDAQRKREIIARRAAQELKDGVRDMWACRWAGAHGSARTTSTLASACRCSFPALSPLARRSTCRARTACSASVRVSQPD